MEQAVSKYQWVRSDGGPLMVLERRLLSHWEGSDAPSGGRIVEAESRWGLDVATDYDRACDVSDWIDSIRVGDGEALIFGGDESAATWLPGEYGADGVVIRWEFADSEDGVMESARAWASSELKGTEISFSSQTSSLVLFAATETGEQQPIYPRLEFTIPAGSYSICTSPIENERMFIICHRFHRLD